jgi:AcrR family transcriptional regulator
MVHSMASAPDTRTALLQAALACFAERGFDGTSIRMIADRAQRPLSLLSHYFGNKEGLYLEVFKFIFQETFQKRLKHPSLAEACRPRDQQEAIRILREEFHTLYLDMLQEPDPADLIRECGTRLWLQEIRSPRPSLYPLLKEYLGPLTGTVRKCIETLRPELSEGEVRLLGISVLGIVTGHGLMRGVNQVVWGKLDPPGSAFQAAEWLVDLSLHGLLGSGPDPEAGKGPGTQSDDQSNR